MPARDADHLTLTTQEIRVINEIRRMPGGEMRIIVENYGPVRIQEIRRDIPLRDKQEPPPEPLKGGDA